MKQKEIIIKYEEYDRGEELLIDDSLILNEAKQALETSYAPYSEFNVGAAVLLDDGTIIRGSNQENSAYPSGLCAERVALFYTSSEYPRKVIKSIAITSKAVHFESSEPISPCGSCRQVISETEKRQGKQIRIIMRNEIGKTKIVDGIDSLLPMKFQEDNLKKSNR